MKDRKLMVEVTKEELELLEKGELKEKTLDDFSTEEIIEYLIARVRRMPPKLVDNYLDINGMSAKCAKYDFGEYTCILTTDFNNDTTDLNLLDKKFNRV